MIRFPAFFAMVALLLPPASVFAESRRDEQHQAYAQMRAGKVKPLREIEAIVLPRMRNMEYLGPDYDPVARVYRLKFIDGGRVMFVDVDASTGQILRQR